MNENYEYYLRQCNQKQLKGLLREVQSRLGTRSEQIGDLDLVMSISYRLNELRTHIRHGNERPLPR
jgi:hypothetical protein